MPVHPKYCTPLVIPSSFSHLWRSILMSFKVHNNHYSYQIISSFIFVHHVILRFSSPLAFCHSLDKKKLDPFMLHILCYHDISIEFNQCDFFFSPSSKPFLKNLKSKSNNEWPINQSEIRLVPKTILFLTTFNRTNSQT